MYKQEFYHPDTLLSEMLKQNYQLNMTLVLLDIKLGFCPRAKAKEVCAQHNVSVDLLLFICNMYSFDEYKTNDYPGSLPFDESLEYILRVNKYTQKEIFPYVKQEYKSIEGLLTVSQKNNLEKILADFLEVFNKFFVDFEEVTKEFLKTRERLNLLQTRILFEQIDEIIILIELMSNTLSKSQASSGNDESYNHFKYYLAFLMRGLPKHQRISKYALKPMFSE
ncbi:MAG: hypothetical protein LBQ60_19735 [Bacteroidales bacterium]|jgi:hypothetical protein|nr:hypothetical protein [Bacteroidales bacterium]